MREENDELALREIASLAVFLFEYNQSCSDDFLENTLLEIGNRLGLPACERQISDIRSLKNCKVLFFFVYKYMSALKKCNKKKRKIKKW